MFADCTFFADGTFFAGSLSVFFPLRAIAIVEGNE
jgi:hypothetical protein